MTGIAAYLYQQSLIAGASRHASQQGNKPQDSQQSVGSGQSHGSQSNRGSNQLSHTGTSTGGQQALTSPPRLVPIVPGMQPPAGMQPGYPPSAFTSATHLYAPPVQ